MRETYYDYLFDTIKSMSGSEEFDPILYNLPKFFKLLCDLLSEDVVDVSTRRTINSALAYFVVPVDIVPDDIYEGWGYMDDLYVLSYALEKIRKDFSESIYDNWDEDERFEDALERSIDATEKFVDEKGLKEKILRYAGLEE